MERFPALSSATLTVPHPTADLLVAKDCVLMEGYRWVPSPAATSLPHCAALDSAAYGEAMAP